MFPFKLANVVVRLRKRLKKQWGQICNKLRKHKNAPVFLGAFLVESVFVAVATAKRNCVLKNTFAKRSFELVCSP